MVCAEIDGAFTPGARLDAKIRPTLVDPEVAKMQQELDGTPFVIVVEDVEPPRRLSFRWHPYAPESEYPDVQEEPMTLVTFTLEAASADPERTRLTIVESGFHALPDGRRAEAYESNEGGWEHQTRMIGQYLKQGLDRAEA